MLTVYDINELKRHFVNYLSETAEQSPDLLIDVALFGSLFIDYMDKKAKEEWLAENKKTENQE